MKSVALLFLLAFMPASQLLHAQLPDSLDAKQWAKALSDKNDKENKALTKMDSLLSKKDSTSIIRFLDELQKHGETDDNYFQARYNLDRAGKVNFFNAARGYNSRAASKETERLVKIAMDKAYASEDEYLIALVSKWYPRIAGDIGIKILYNLNYITLSEKLSLPVTDFDYNYLADMLYGVRAYTDCIQYANKAIKANRKSHDAYYRPENCFNTIALAYQKQGQYDSALKYYRLALQVNNQTHTGGWNGIVSGNMGQVYYALGKYDTAYSLLKEDYDTAMHYPWYDESANALQWMARTDLALGNTGKALAEIRQAFRELQLFPFYQPWNYRNMYYTKTLVFKELKEYDSAFYFNNLYTALNDSIEQSVAASSLSITRARMNDLNSRNKIQALNREKQAEITTRNIMVSSVVLFAVIALLLVNRKRLKTKLEKEKAQQEKALVQHEKMLLQQEMVSAQQQLKMFTDNIVEKSAIIEKLQQQQEMRADNQEQDVIVQELVQKSILTEADWLHFKTLFEKAHPGFFTRLKEQANSITLAEIRMAALTRMPLTTQQMANVLGISANSIVKAKQRLRQRFNLQTNYEVEEFMGKL